MNYYEERIDLNTEKMFGMPSIKGTSVSVQYILLELSNGKSSEDIISSNPEITHADIYACLAFASEAVNNYTKPKTTSNLNSKENADKERLKRSLFGKYGNQKKNSSSD